MRYFVFIFLVIAAAGISFILPDPLCEAKENKHFVSSQSKIQINLRRGSVGLGYHRDRSKNIFVRPLPGGSAFKAGVKRGWLLVKVNGESLRDKSLPEIVKMISGPIDTAVTLTFHVNGNLINKILIRKRQREVAYSDPLLAQTSNIYQKTWLLVKRAYCDQTYNHQDWNYWKDKYNGKLKTEEDAVQAIKTMLASLGDPSTRYVSKNDLDEVSAKLVGVGIQLGMNKKKKIVVIQPIKGGPAIKSGVKPGWIISAIDHKTTENHTLDQIVKKIRGKLGTTVVLDFKVKGKTISKALKRQVIGLNTVANSEVLKSGIGYIRLDVINERTVKELRKALNDAQSAKALILDLRNNPGGRRRDGTVDLHLKLPPVIKIAELFIDRGKVILSSIDSDGYKNTTFANSSPSYTGNLVILANRGTAKLAEILAMTLRDSAKATIIGERTFGDCTIQALYQLNYHSGVHLTIAKILPPSEVNIQKSGIKPDIEVPLTKTDYERGVGPWWIDLSYKNLNRSPNDGNDKQLNKAIELLLK